MEKIINTQEIVIDKDALSFEIDAKEDIKLSLKCVSDASVFFSIINASNLEIEMEVINGSNVSLFFSNDSDNDVDIKENYSVNKDSKLSVSYSEFNDIIKAIDDMDADVITFEASRSDLQILDALRDNHFETEVGPGVYDIHSPRVPSVDEIVAAVNIMLTKIDREKLWINPDCGLKTRGVSETTASLKNMVEAAKQIRENA